MNLTRMIRLLAAAGAMTLLGTLGVAGPAMAVTPAPRSATTSPFVELVNHDGKCLSIEGGALASGAAATQFTCNGAASQLWDIKQVVIEDELVVQLIENKNSSECLTLQNNDSNRGAAVVQEACNNSGSDTFEDWSPELDPNTTRTYIIYNVGRQSGSPECLFTPGNEGLSECAMHPSGNGTANSLHIFDNNPTGTSNDSYLWESE